MRRLADELGVSGPSLYHHFTNKDEILDGITARVNEQIELRCTPPDWEGMLTEHATQLRALLNSHPYIVEFLALRPVKSIAGLRIYEHLISGLAACGWPPDLAREAGLAVESLVFGSALQANAPDIDLDDEQRLEFPTLAMTSSGPSPNPPDDGFELGFAALIAGLRVLISDRPAAARPKPRRPARALPADPRAARHRSRR